MESNMRKHSWQACFENFSCNILQRVILPCAMYFLGYPTRLPSRLLSSRDPYGPLGQIMAHVSIVEPVGIQHIQPVGWTPDLLLKSGRCCDRNSGKGSRFPRRLVCLVILGHAPVVMSQRLFWWQEWSTVYPSGDLQLSCQVVDSCSPAPELSFEKKARTWGGAQVTDGQLSVLGYMKDTWWFVNGMQLCRLYE